jgi:tetratricopeptide (TPR) repeat protein
MSYIKKRVPRKPGPTPQEIIADQRTLANWISENTNLIVYTSGVILLVLVVGLGIVWMKGEKRDAANSALSGAMALYQTTVAQIDDEAYADTEGLQAALESLDGVASEYRGDPQGNTASLFKANVLFRLERYDEAAETIRQLRASDPRFVNDINGFYLLARSYEALEDYTMAIDTYEEAQERAYGDLRAVIDIDLARCYELSGDQDTAVSIYREILSEYPDTIFASRAEKKLAIMGVRDEETL